MPRPCRLLEAFAARLVGDFQGRTACGVELLQSILSIEGLHVGQQVLRIVRIDNRDRGAKSGLAQLIESVNVAIFAGDAPAGDELGASIRMTCGKNAGGPGFAISDGMRISFDLAGWESSPHQMEPVRDGNMGKSRRNCVGSRDGRNRCRHSDRRRFILRRRRMP